MAYVDILRAYDRVEVARVMQTGGHFMSALSQALIRADGNNESILYDSFGHMIWPLVKDSGIRPTEH